MNQRSKHSTNLNGLSPLFVRRGNNQGFTLVEISVAVAILGIALVTLIGLHTRMLGVFADEQNRVKASFLAQYLMTMQEKSENQETGSETQSLAAVLEDSGYFEAWPDYADKETYDGWTFTKEVTPIDLPEKEGALLRLDISVAWGPASDQEFALLYFVAPPPKSEDNSGEQR